jgi:eukaryotic-like serine/threonine-protein kinase
LNGSVSSLGTQYVIGLEAVACSTGDTLAKEQAESASKESVLKALGTAATILRAKLGESLASVQKFDVPVEATTPSLEALKAYSMGITTGRTKGDAEAIPFLKRPSNSTLTSPLPMPVLPSSTEISGRQVSRPTMARRPTTCAIA